MSVQDLLNLPAEERAELAAALLESLDESTGPNADTEWGEEIRRRLDDVGADQGRTMIGIRPAATTGRS